MFVIDSDRHCHNEKIDCLKTNGVDVIFRYYARAKQNGFKEKILEADEAKALSAEFFIAACYQYGARTDGVFSNAQGLEDARFARKYAASVIKQPAQSAIYFGVDYDPLDSVLENNIVPHFQGIAAGMSEASPDGYPHYDVGVYGAWHVCKRLKEAKLAKYAWLSNSTGWGDHQGRKKYVESTQWTLLQTLPQQDLCGVDHDPNGVLAGITSFGQFKSGL